MNDINLLKQKYKEILSELDSSFFDKKHLDTKYHEGKGLSGLFLPSEPENYFQAKNKIMIIGAETTKWDVLKEVDFTDLSTYIDLSMKKQENFFSKQLSLPKTGKITFHDFTRSIAHKSGKDGLVYCNLFCFSWKRKSPIKSKYFTQIKNISAKLLKAQLDYFKPDIIILANGMSSTQYRREIFPLNKCSQSVIFENEGINKNQLWQFDFDNKYLCYRVHHPSTIRGRLLAQRARDKLISLLPEL